MRFLARTMNLYHRWRSRRDMANADYHSRRAEEWAAKLRELEGRQ